MKRMIFKKFLSCSPILFFALTLLLSSCESNKEPYNLPACLVSSKEDLIKSVTESDLDFFSKWTSDTAFCGYILDVVDSLSYSEISERANCRYDELSDKNKNYNFKGYATYILYCVDSGDIYVKIPDVKRSILESIFPGDYFRLVTDRYNSASSILRALNSFIELSYSKYDSLSFIRKISLDESILSSLNLKLSALFIPSNSIIYKLFFSIPFGVGMSLVKFTKSLSLSAWILLFLYFFHRMAFLRRKKANRFNVITTCWWSISILYFLAFCCVVNTISPLCEIKYGLINNGYSQVYESVYDSYYLSYHSSAVSIFTRIIFCLVFILYWIIHFVRKFGKEDMKDMDGAGDEVYSLFISLVTIFLGACSYQRSIIYVFIAYLSIRIIEYIYVLFVEDKNENHSKEKLLSFKIFLLIFVCISFLYPLAKDNPNISSVVLSHVIICWTFFSLSSVYLFIHFAVKFSNNDHLHSMFELFDKQCDFSGVCKNPVLNMVVSDYALFTGLYSPLFIVECILYLAIPNLDIWTFGLMSFLTIVPCSLASLFIFLNLPSVFKPEEFIDDVVEECRCPFDTKNTYFNRVLDRAWRFGGLLCLLLILLFIVAFLIMFIKYVLM